MTVHTDTIPHFEWTSDMSVGEATIDRQHQRLLMQLNIVIDAVLNKVDSKEVVSAVAFFKQYADEHLLYEEAYMARHRYEGVADHIKKHQEFRDTYASLQDKLINSATPENLLLEIESFLGGWWTRHILHEDKKYYEALGPDEG